VVGGARDYRRKPPLVVQGVGNRRKCLPISPFAKLPNDLRV
jgi:hypothetical protein